MNPDGKKLHYLSSGDAQVEAILYEDRVCVGEQVCAERGRVFSYDEQVGLEQQEGVLGLGPQATALFGQLCTHLDSCVFGMALSRQEYRSAVMFGGVDPSFFEGELFYEQVLFEDCWSVLVKNLTFEGLLLYGVPAFGPPTRLSHAQLHSAAANLVLPDSAFNLFKQAIQKATTEPIYQQVDGLFYFADGCPKMDPILIFLDSGRILSVPSDQYFESFGDVCLIRVSSSGDNDLIILGDTFMRQYYVVFDHGNKKLGFATQIKQEWPVSNMAIAIILVTVAILAAIVLFCVVRKRKSKKPKKKIKVNSKMRSLLKKSRKTSNTTSGLSNTIISPK